MLQWWLECLLQFSGISRWILLERRCRLIFHFVHFLRGKSSISRFFLDSTTTSTTTTSTTTTTTNDRTTTTTTATTDRTTTTDPTTTYSTTTSFTTPGECSDQRFACRAVRWHRRRQRGGGGRRRGRRGRARSLNEDFKEIFDDLSTSALDRQRRRGCDLRFWWSRRCRSYYSCRRPIVATLCPQACDLCWFNQCPL